MKSNQTYKDLLKRSEWQVVRNNVLERDGHECQNCGNKKIINNSLRGSLISITRKKTLFEVLNQSDPRFQYEYLVKFRVGDGNIYNYTIYAPHDYPNDELDRLIETTIFYHFEKSLSFMDSESESPYIICIKGNKASTNKWFYVKRLEIHHTYYDESLLPWQYRMESLKTLCWVCHEQEHAD